MALSDDDSDEGEQQRHGKKGMKKVKKHLTEEEEEAIHEAKGAKKAKEWLDSEFGGFKKVCRNRESVTCVLQHTMCRINSLLLPSVPRLEPTSYNIKTATMTFAF